MVREETEVKDQFVKIKEEKIYELTAQYFQMADNKILFAAAIF